MLTSPISFREADRLIESREPAATAKTHRQIVASWSDDMKARSFFAARCTNAAILAQLKTLAERIVAGKMTQKQAVRLAREMFAAGADALAAMGFAPKEDARGLAELASISRLNLIFYTQTRMAQEKGHYEQWERVKDKFPYAVWHCGYAREHRAEHLARDGKVYAFDHPIWTQSPPGGEFNCHCWREPITEKQLHERGLAPEAADVAFKPSSLGFDPSKPLDAHNGIRPGKNIPPELRPAPEPPVAPPPPVVAAPPGETPEQHREKRRRQWRQAYQKRLANDCQRFKLKTIAEEHAIEQDAEKVNPNYQQGWEYQNNCQRCVIAAEARRRGLDVEALPRLNQNDPLAMAFSNAGIVSVFQNATVDDFIWCGGDTPQETQENIEQRMLEFGEGARAIIRVFWKRGSGHVFNIEVHDGKVTFYDAQNPNRSAKDFFALVRCGKMAGILAPSILRVDKRKFTNRLLECCKSRGGKR